MNVSGKRGEEGSRNGGGGGGVAWTPICSLGGGEGEKKERDFCVAFAHGWKGGKGREEAERWRAER